AVHHDRGWKASPSNWSCRLGSQTPGQITETKSDRPRQAFQSTIDRGERPSTAHRAVCDSSPATRSVPHVNQSLIPTAIDRDSSVSSLPGLSRQSMRLFRKPFFKMDARAKPGHDESESVGII